MLSGAALATPRADGLDFSLVDLYLGAVGPRRELHERVKRYWYPGAFFLCLLHKVGIDATNDGLVRNDENVLAALQFHDDGLEADHYIPVALTAAVAVVVLVFVASLEIFRVHVGDLLVRHAVADTSVELVERLPL